MEESAQAQAYATTDFSEPHNHFVALFASRFGSQRGRVADLGCGPADVTLRFARAHPECSVDGFDGADAMLIWGEKAVEEAGLQERIALRCTRLPLRERPPPFDALISNSLLHHLADPSVLWETVHQLAVDGAPVFIMDLMRPHSEADVDRLTMAYAADVDPILREDFRASLHAAYTPAEVRSQLRLAGLDAFSVETVTDRHLIVYGYYRRP